MKYKIIATTKEGVKFENEIVECDKVIEVVIKLRNQGLTVEVYKMEKIFG